MIDVGSVALVVNTAFVTFGVLRLIDMWRHRKAPGCTHCWHWLFTTRMGTTIHQYCCHCGHIRGTYVVGRDAITTLRTGEHGQFVEYKSEQDRGVA